METGLAKVLPAGGGGRRRLAGVRARGAPTAQGGDMFFGGMVSCTAVYLLTRMDQGGHVYQHGHWCGYARAHVHVHCALCERVLFSWR